MSEKLAARQSVRSLTMLLTAVYFVSYLTRVNYGAVVSEIVAVEGIRKSAASLALTGSAVTYGAGQLVSGCLGDRIEPRRMVCCGLCITILANLSIPMCHTVAPMAAVWTVNGFAQSLMWPPLVRLMTAFLSEEDYRRTCVQVSGGSAVGTAAVYLISPLLIRLSGWRSVFTACAAAAVVMLLVWLRRCPASPQNPASRKRRITAPGNPSVSQDFCWSFCSASCWRGCCGRELPHGCPPSFPKASTSAAASPFSPA